MNPENPMHPMNPENPLKTLMAQLGVTAAELAAALRQTGGRRRGQPFSRPAVSHIVNHGQFPRTTPAAEVRRQIGEFLAGRGATPESLEGLWPAAATAGQGRKTKRTEKTQEATMLPKKSNLSQAALKHFQLRGQPFGDVEHDGQMYLGPAHRYARESLLEGMRGGGFKALVGESGSGKTTLLEECEEHIRRHGLGVALIRPPIVGMDRDTARGAPLRARSILMHILDAIAPESKRPQDLPRLTARAQRELAERQSGRRHCLVIDDAHRLNGHTLCHLKDFYELKLGRQRLLGIVLLGQPHLAARLDPANYELIQISQRCEVLALPPLCDDLPDYLQTRLAAAGSSARQVFAEDAYAALAQRLTGASPPAGRGKPAAVNLAYPLAVNNLAAAAMNLAAEFGAPAVTAEIVQETR